VIKRGSSQRTEKNWRKGRCNDAVCGGSGGCGDVVFVGDGDGGGCC